MFTLTPHSFNTVDVEKCSILKIWTTGDLKPLSPFFVRKSPGKWYSLTMWWIYPTNLIMLATAHANKSNCVAIDLNNAAWFFFLSLSFWQFLFVDITFIIDTKISPLSKVVLWCVLSQIFFYLKVETFQLKHFWNISFQKFFLVGLPNLPKYR